MITSLTLVPLMLAPMQGLTNRAFRGVFGQTVKPDVLFTEFVRVVNRPTPTRILQKHLGGPAPNGIPVGVQLMGSDLEALAESARRAGNERHLAAEVKHI